ncbi:MAG: putative rane protein [Fibrobacteres bacterium]|nr:putative rane protein [Fibrobacterota bacterium]
MVIAACTGSASMIVLMALLWGYHLRIRNAAIVDVGWAAGLGLLAWLYAAIGTAPVKRRMLLAGLAGAWAFRLAWHLYRDRVAGGTPEEGRYVYLRSHWGAQANHYFLYFFLGQGVLNIVLAIPFLLTAYNPGEGPGLLEGSAAALWLVALSGESLADAQLKAFKADPSNRGQVCRKGLWNLSRHPNYFFEWLIWCAYALMASASIPGGLGAWGALGWLSPAIILFLLLKVSGIPPTEKQAMRSRGAAYADYQASVNAFFPWFPRARGKNANERTAP